jgi:hypothetical protein
MHMHARGGVGGGSGGLLLLLLGLVLGLMAGVCMCGDKTHVFSGAALLWYQTLDTVC